MDRETSVRDAIFTVISRHFAIPRDRIKPELTFADLDLDSVALVELAVVLQEELDLDVTEVDFLMEDSIGRLAELLAADPAR
ncbi:acyl carrier protein [Nocardia sp. NPDC050175]|uniref:acyl carrier protein n=1 Tax=Nocardia sp. NPDC050175 TaxID=3364317 RepID=UPI0037928BDA